jgi:alanyl aminopeptidase
MEHPGAVTFAEAILLLDPASATFAQRRLLAMVIAHELAHMWFGDLVTMEWWDDLWLNEGFASWMATKITDQVFPEFQQSTATLGGIQRAMGTDAMLASRAVRQPIIDLPNLIQSADEITFDKSEALIGMMERWLGAEEFRQGMIAYMQAHEWGNATAADLWAALEEVSGAKTNGIDEIMATFLDRPGVPLVGVDLLPDSRIRLSQQRFLNYGVEDPDPDRLWQIPVTLRYPDGDRVRTQRVLLTEKTQTFALESTEAPAWIHPNAGEHGYYRWQVAPSMFEKLAQNASLNLDLRERLGLLDLLSALLDAGSLHGDALLATLGHFANDPEPQVINGLAGQLAGVRSVFVDEEMEEAFATYVQRTLGPAWRHFGRQRVDGEPEAVSLARPNLMGFLGDEGRDSEVLAYADSLAQAYLETPSSVDPALSAMALALAATHGDRNLFESYRMNFERARVPADRQRYLRAMGSFRVPEIVQLALDYSLAADLHLQEMYIIPFAVGSYPPFRDTYFEWMVRNYDAIAARIPPEFAAGLPRVAGGCSMERLEKARAFFSEPAHAPPGTERELAEVAEAVTGCVELREREGEAVRTYLRGAVTQEPR